MCLLHREVQLPEGNLCHDGHPAPVQLSSLEVMPGLVGSEERKMLAIPANSWFKSGQGTTLLGSALGPGSLEVMRSSFTERGGQAQQDHTRGTPQPMAGACLFITLPSPFWV